jgi:hypothetical protein
MSKLILSILATYRLSQLVAWDNGPLFVFYRLRSYVNSRSETDGELWENLDEGINCPYCLGMYFSFVCAILFLRPKGVKDLFLYWLSIAGGQAFLQGITKER